MRLARLLPILSTWACLGCDSFFGRWDQVRVEIGDPEAAAVQTDGGATTDGTTTGGPTGPTDTTKPVVEAGADVLTNASFSRTATATDDAAMTYRWEKTSGTGTVTFSAATSLTTDVSASSSGVYTIRFTATDASGNATSDTFSLNWDATPPSPPALGAMKLAADSAGGADVPIDDDANVYLVWGAADDGAGSGVRDYTLLIFTQPACGGASTDVPGIIGNDYMAAGADADTVSFKVKAFDKLNQEGALSDCKSGIKIDLTDPVALQAFTVDDGATLPSATVATNRVTVNFPDGAAQIADYAQVVVRRLKGATPNVACTDGKVAKTYTGAFPDPDTFLDYTDEAGASFDYRVCITDAAGRLKATDVATAKVSKPHILFATAQGYMGDLAGLPLGGPANGLGRADFICDETAANSATPEVASEPNWKAVMSDKTSSAKNRLSVVGIVKNPFLSTTLANDFTTIWSAPLQTFVETDTGGLPQAFALTGTRTNGTRGTLDSQDCTQWTSSAGTGWVGDTNGLAPWLNVNEAAPVNCTDGGTEYSVYCLSQPADAPAITTMALAPAPGPGIRITITLPPDISRYAQIELYRQGLGTAPSAECDSGFIDTIPPTTGGAVLTYDDASATSGATFSYRACVFDAAGNIITTKTALSGVAN